MCIRDRLSTGGRDGYESPVPGGDGGWGALNSGGGGGGSGHQAPKGGDGGSGIIILRYEIAPSQS